VRCHQQIWIVVLGGWARGNWELVVGVVQDATLVGPEAPQDKSAQSLTLIHFVHKNDSLTTLKKPRKPI